MVAEVADCVVMAQDFGGALQVCGQFLGQTLSCIGVGKQ